MSDTPMTREQAWETVAGAVDDFRIYLADEAGERAETALAFLRSEMERLEGERDRKIAEVAEFLGETAMAVENVNAPRADIARVLWSARDKLVAALPDTEGEQNIARVWKRVADDAHDRIAELQSTVERLEGECKDADLAAAAEAQLADERSERAEAAEARVTTLESLVLLKADERKVAEAQLAEAREALREIDGVTKTAAVTSDRIHAIQAVARRILEQGDKDA